MDDASPSLSPSHSTRRKFLVCGGDTRSFLAVVRSLGRSGAEVHAAFSPRESAALHSRYLARIHYLPPFQPNDDKWLLALEELLASQKFDLVVPCTDNALLPLRLARTRLESQTRLLMADEGVYELFSDKIATYKLAQQLGVPQPKAVVVTSSSQFEEALSQLGLPIVVKPHHSVSIENPHSKLHVWMAHSESDLRSALSGVSPTTPILLQQFVPGRGVGLEVLAADGEIRMAFQHQRIHEPLRGGGSTYRRGMKIDPQLLKWAQALASAAKLTGVAMFEFRIDSKSGGRPYFFEVNSRFWGSLPLAIASGADFPLSASQLLLDHRRDFPQNFREDLFCRNLVLDLRWCYDNFFADHSDQYLLTEPRIRTALEWLNLLKGIERSDTFTTDDFVPGIRELLGYGAKLVIRVWSRLTQLVYLLPVVRQKTRARATDLFRAARRIIFVCKGNICRSPFAAYYAARRFPEKFFDSAGLLAESGEKSPRFAIEVAETFAASLLNHESVRLNAANLEQADLIIVFESRQREELLSRNPSLIDKIIVFEDLGWGAPRDVIDPFGGPRESFKQCYERIARVIDGLKSASSELN